MARPERRFPVAFGKGLIVAVGAGGGRPDRELAGVQISELHMLS